MDIYKETVDLVKAYNKCKSESDNSSLIKIVCNYFDKIKNQRLSTNDYKFLFELSNHIGVPQYYDLLLDKFSKEIPVIDDFSLDTVSALICESSLRVDGIVKLHKYQKKVLDRFIKDEKNRYVLTAPTSFGKTFLTYQIIKKMRYHNVVLIFPTISLLGENYKDLINNRKDKGFFSEYSIHTLSDDMEIGGKNIWLFTPERFLSYIDKNPKQKFDFIFIDEIYKIDNEYIIDNETTGENERDTAYRIALEYSCRKAIDILMAGPYMKIIENDGYISDSFGNFTKDREFEILDYNSVEIVNKHIYEIRGKKEYTIENKVVNIGSVSIYEKVANIVNEFTTTKENTIIYYCTKAGTEKYATKMCDLLNLESFYNDKSDGEKQKYFIMFLNHISNTFGEDWIVLKALKNRIGIHHGLVPKYIQKEIINLFNSGMLLVLISTTTITEGVNTSAKNIIICSEKKGSKQLRNFDARNIVGRAGRFSYHYVGRVFTLKKEIDEILEVDEETLKHKNFDEKSKKTQVDVLITDDKYLKQHEIETREYWYNEVKKRSIPHEAVEQFKTVSYEDKVKMYDLIESLNREQVASIKILIRNLQVKRQIDWSGFQCIIDIIQPIVSDIKLQHIINCKCKGQEEKYAVITAKVYYYLRGGFFGLLQFSLGQGDDKNHAVRETADLIYNVFKYNLVKYLGIFDIMYRSVRAKKENKKFEEVSGISILLKKLEYNALNDNARRLSDYGVPFKLVDYYENDLTTKNFDEYERFIDSQIVDMLV